MNSTGVKVFVTSSPWETSLGLNGVWRKYKAKCLYVLILSKHMQTVWSVCLAG